MPTIELIAEIEALKKQIEAYKMCLKFMDKKNRELCQLWSGIAREKLRADAAESQLESLKKDAREIGEILTENGCDCECDCDCSGHSESCEPCMGCRIDVILIRILEETKEES